MSESNGPTVEVPTAVTFDDVYRYIQADFYIRRRATYDIRAIVNALALEHPGAELDDVNEYALWDLMEARIECLHSPVAGMMHVHEEDLASVVDGGQHVECIKCGYVFLAESHIWTRP